MRSTIVLLVLLLVLPAPCLDDPAAVVESYYVHLNNRDYAAALALKSPTARRATSLTAFRQNWQSCESIGFYSGPEIVSSDSRKAVLRYTLGSVDALPGKMLRYGRYSARATLLRGSGRWWIDSISVQQLSTEDYPRHEIDRPDLPVPDLPEVPVLGGFTMRPPVARELSGGGLDYTVRCRSRQLGVRPYDLAKEYVAVMPDQGWSPEPGGLAGGATSLGVSFRRGDWVVYVSITSTTWGGTDAPADPRGTELAFSYRRAGR